MLIGDKEDAKNLPVLKVKNVKSAQGCDCIGPSGGGCQISQPGLGNREDHENPWKEHYVNIKFHGCSWKSHPIPSMGPRDLAGVLVESIRFGVAQDVSASRSVQHILGRCEE